MQESSVPTCVMAFVVYDLLRRCIISYCGGLYYIQNLQVIKEVVLTVVSIPILTSLVVIDQRGVCVYHSCIILTDTQACA